MQQQFKHFNCCYHDADDMNKFMQFLLKVDKSIMKHLSPWWKEKGCHGNDNGNGATATFRFWYSIEIPMQRGSVRMRAKDGGALPDTGFPHVGGKAKEGQRAPIVRTRGKTRVHLIQHACVRSRASSQGYTFEACKRDDSRSVQSRGSSCSRFVVVHTS